MQLLLKLFEIFSLMVLIGSVELNCHNLRWIPFYSIVHNVKYEHFLKFP